MTHERDALTAELGALRKGRGVHERNLQARMGEQLHRLFGIAASDDDTTIRIRIGERVHELLADAPPDLATAVLAALGLHPECRLRFLAERTDWLAAELGCEARTARRRIDDGFALLVEAAGPRRRLSSRGEGDGDGWTVRSFRATLRLDGPGPELIDERQIVAVRDGLREIPVSMSLPPAPDTTVLERDLVAEVLYGGHIRAKDRVSASHFRYWLELPSTLQAGQKHEYSVAFRIPPGQPMSPHYAFLPLWPCEYFHLRVRFGQSRQPAAVWRLDGVPPRLVDEQPARGDLLELDRLGEVELEFRPLRTGLGYGIGWTPTPMPTP